LDLVRAENDLIHDDSDDDDDDDVRICSVSAEGSVPA